MKLIWGLGDVRGPVSRRLRAPARHCDEPVSLAGGRGESIDDLLRLATVPGLGIAAVRGADITVEGFGLRRAGTTDRVTGDTVFEAASLSKPVFAAIVMQLATEGVVDLSRPLAQYLGRRHVWHWGDNPGFKNFVVAEPAAGTALVIFTNGNAGQRVYERVIRARTGVDHPAFLWV